MRKYTQLHTLLQKKSLARMYTSGRGCKNHVYINTHNIYYVNLYDSLMLPLAETQPDESYQFSFNPLCVVMVRRARSEPVINEDCQDVPT